MFLDCLFDSPAFHQSPDWNDFERLVVTYQIAVNWKMFGTSLGFDKSKMECIEQDNFKNPCKWYLVCVYTEWKNRGRHRRDFTWRTVVIVLNLLGEFRIADDVYKFCEENYLKDHPSTPS